MRTKQILLLLVLACVPLVASAQKRPYTLDVRHGSIYGDNEQLDPEYIVQILDQNGVQAYESATGLQRLGNNLMIAGGGAMVVSGLLYGAKALITRNMSVEQAQGSSSQVASGKTAGIVSLCLAGLGATALGTGLTLRIVGNNRLEGVAHDYNYGPSVSLGVTPGGLGLAMRF